MDGGTWIRRAMDKGSHFKILTMIGVYLQGNLIEMGMIFSFLDSFGNPIIFNYC